MTHLKNDKTVVVSCMSLIIHLFICLLSNFNKIQQNNTGTSLAYLEESLGSKQL